ncbi:patatin [Flammeovirgaceae bacterium 311]|nr:patatin [Flammeovirgaceae bacterium 311]
MLYRFLLITTLLISFSSTAQVYKNLVFEGAGIRGLAYAGALKELEKQGLLLPVEKVGGTSAGAITALAVSLGYSSHELEELIYNTDFQQFNDGRFIFIGGISRTTKRFGWYRGEKITRWIGNIIEKKTGNADITFLELHQQGYKELYITGTSLNQQKLLVFSHHNYPHMKVKDAVRISISIPLYYGAVCIDKDGRVLKQKNNTSCDNVMVDGGIVGNFPIHIFDSTRQQNGETARVANQQTLGFRIDSDAQIQSDAEGQGLAPVDIQNFMDYTGAFYIYVLESLNRTPLTEEDWDRTVSISSADIGPRVKRLNKEQKELLIENGRMAVVRFMEAGEDPTGL